MVFPPPAGMLRFSSADSDWTFRTSGKESEGGRTGHRQRPAERRLRRTPEAFARRAARFRGARLSRQRDDAAGGGRRRLGSLRDLAGAEVLRRLDRPRLQTGYAASPAGRDDTPSPAGVRVLQPARARPPRRPADDLRGRGRRTPRPRGARGHPGRGPRGGGRGGGRPGAGVPPPPRRHRGRRRGHEAPGGPVHPGLRHRPRRRDGDGGERIYLAQLAHQLGLEPDDAARLESRAASRIDEEATRTDDGA